MKTHRDLRFDPLWSPPVYLMLCLAMLLQSPTQPQTKPQPQHRPIPPHTQWHHWHGQRFSVLQTQYSSSIVVVSSPDTAYVTVDAAGNVIQAYRLVPVAVESAPVVVVPQTNYNSGYNRGWFFRRR